MSTPLHLKALLGDYPVTRALKAGEIVSPAVGLDFAQVRPPSAAFKRVVRELEFDVAELAIMTFLMARAHGKPLVLLPAVMTARFQHPCLVYDPARGPLAPQALAGRRIGIRSYSVTTVAWLRAILAEDYGIAPESVRWVSFEEPHVAEFRDPPQVERAPEGGEILAMLRAGELDAAILGERPAPDSPLRTVIPDTEAAARAWQAKHGAIQINHMVAVKASLVRERPDAVREIYRLLEASRHAAGDPPSNPFGVAANRRNLEAALECGHAQGLIPRRMDVDELFDDVTRQLGTR